MNDLILHTTEDGRHQIKLRAKDRTVWLTPLEMAKRFDATNQNIPLHLKNLFEDGELDAGGTVRESPPSQIGRRWIATIGKSLVVQATGGNNAPAHLGWYGPGCQPSDPCAFLIFGALPQAGIEMRRWRGRWEQNGEAGHVRVSGACLILRAKGAK